MKEYKVGDTIYVKGKIIQADEDDTALPYCVDFENGTVWISSDNIIDELPTAEPVKPVLPKEVGDEMDLYKNASCAFPAYLRGADLNNTEAKATHQYLYSYLNDNLLQDIRTAALINAWNNGYTVKKESRYMVYVPGTNKKFLYNKRGDSSTRAAKLETPIVPSPVTSYQTAYGQYKPLYWFTDAEITKFGLQDCEKVEVTDDGMGC